jgi:hypothetical protein
MRERDARKKLAKSIDSGEIKVQATREQAQRMLKLISDGMTFGEAWVATL